MKFLVVILISAIIFGAVQTLSTEDKDINQIELDVFTLINTERVSKGRSVLMWDEQLALEAEAHSRIMSDEDKMFHSDMDYYENIIYGSADARSIYDAWKNSPKHYDNLINKDISRGAVGIAMSNKKGIEILNAKTAYATFIAY